MCRDSPKTHGYWLSGSIAEQIAAADRGRISAFRGILSSRRPRLLSVVVQRWRASTVEIVLMFLIAFGIVGSVEARMRILLKRHERQLDAAREDLARVERK